MAASGWVMPACAGNDALHPGRAWLRDVPDFLAGGRIPKPGTMELSIDISGGGVRVMLARPITKCI